MSGRVAWAVAGSMDERHKAVQRPSNGLIEKAVALMAQMEQAQVVFLPPSPTIPTMLPQQRAAPDPRNEHAPAPQVPIPPVGRPVSIWSGLLLLCGGDARTHQDTGDWAARLKMSL
mmetsp:Transcript_52204/g.169602  ORF Transcript_52204/g.169602 Transcript_52204/m.169602 type:complete len:116 (-) Transcript_52204:95-442(-)